MFQLLDKKFGSYKNGFYIFIITFTIFSVITTSYIFEYENQLQTNPKINFIFLFSGDEPMYLSMASNIIYNQSIFVDEHFEGQFKKPRTDPNMDWPEQFKNSRTWHSVQRTDDHWVSKHGYGLGYLIIPGYYMGGFFGVFTTINLLLSLTCVVIYNFTARLTSNKIGFITSLIFGFSTIMINTISKVYTDVVMMFFAIFVLYIIFCKSSSEKFMIISGLILGYFVFFKTTFIVLEFVFISLLLILFLKKQIKLKPLLFFIICFSIVSCVSFIHNYYVYENFLGGPHSQTYLSILYGNASSSVGALHGQDPAHRIISFEEIFFGKDHGLFILSPILLLSALGIGPLFKTNKLLLVTIISIISFIVFIYLLVLPTIPVVAMGVVFRYFLPILPMFSIPFALGMYYFRKSIGYKILFGYLLAVSSSINISLAILSENAASNHNLLKLEIIDTMYFGLSYVFPALGPTMYGKKSLPFHQPLTEINVMFLIAIIFLISFAIFISFRYEQKTN